MCVAIVEGVNVLSGISGTLSRSDWACCTEAVVCGWEFNAKGYRYSYIPMLLLPQPVVRQWRARLY